MASNEVRTEIERLINEKQEELSALKATLRMVSGVKTTPYIESNTDSKETSKDGTVDLDSLGVVIHDSGPTLFDRVKSTFPQIPENKEFTIPHVEAILKNNGFTIPGKNPRARLAMIMNQLEKQDLVIRTAKPRGFKPHRFKVKNKSQSVVNLTEAKS